MAKDRIHPIDRIVGTQLRLARTSRGLSQTQLAETSGITFQQVQKYEKGTNRVSASRLFEFASVLGVEIAYFYQGAAKEETNPLPARPFSNISKVDSEIVRAVSHISDRGLKRSLLDVISRLSSPTLAVPKTGKRAPGSREAP